MLDHEEELSQLGAVVLINETLADSIVQSRLLVLQSKRLVLKSLERRLQATGSDSFRERADVAESEAEGAFHAYQASVLKFASPSTIEYWRAVYKRLINAADEVVGGLQSVAPDLPAEQRYLVSTDVEALEECIDDWTQSLRATIRGFVA